ncbi:SRPBCC family protein [Actinoplanes friuliensis]|uniref:Activator of Hsp90 ATPase 1 family protein n=1 Tax=Actinoplanes friuliensis DSM 7358 TaxID=1246995 RepID=U5W1B6_9ACTN|nr:SRPBCC domain-containing protein [Actinoplanes friuliensis]AGZ41691.1 Activator of Hsp90 ATPase 1 family protein [Actinoplanes friuliensis DSM 7358]
MTVLSVHKDPEARRMTLTAEYDAPVDRVWLLWSDPRRLERWWGPPTHPATVVDHDLRPGGKVSYYVTGPDGERSPGWWHVRAVDAPRRLDFELGDAGIPPLAVRVRMDDRPGGGTLMVVETTFPTTGAMDQLIVMGYEQGLSTAVGQADAVLAAD